MKKTGINKNNKKSDRIFSVGFFNLSGDNQRSNSRFSANNTLCSVVIVPAK